MRETVDRFDDNTAAVEHIRLAPDVEFCNQRRGEGVAQRVANAGNGNMEEALPDARAVNLGRFDDLLRNARQGRLIDDHIPAAAPPYGDPDDGDPVEGNGIRPAELAKAEHGVNETVIRIEHVRPAAHYNAQTHQAGEIIDRLKELVPAAVRVDGEGKHQGHNDAQGHAEKDEQHRVLQAPAQLPIVLRAAVKQTRAQVVKADPYGRAAQIPARKRGVNAR